MAAPATTPTPYDFRRPNTFNRDHVRALQIVGETFARQFTTTLSTSLRAVSQVQLDGVGQVTYDEYIRDIPNPSFLAVLSLPPLPGSSLLHVPLPVVMAIIDRMLGGTAAGALPSRPLTDIEATLVRSLLDRVLRELAYALEPLTRVQPELTGMESNPQFAQVTSATDMVIMLSFPLRVGSVSGTATLCVPFASLQPVLEEVSGSTLRSARPVARPDALRRAIGGRLDDAAVDVAVRFEIATVPSAEVVDLRPGDIVPLRHPVDRPLTVTVAGVPRLAARPGQRGRRLACLIVDPEETADR